MGDYRQDLLRHQEYGALWLLQLETLKRTPKPSPREYWLVWQLFSWTAATMFGASPFVRSETDEFVLERAAMDELLTAWKVDHHPADIAAFDHKCEMAWHTYEGTVWPEGISQGP